MLAWAPNAKKELTRAAMYGQALPFTLEEISTQNGPPKMN